MAFPKTPAPHLKMRRSVYRVLLFAGDGLCVAAALKIAFAMRFRWPLFISVFPLRAGFPAPEIYFPLQWMSLVAWMMAFIISGFYVKINLYSLDELLRVLKGAFGGWVVILAGTFLFRGIEYSRLVLAFSGLFVFLGVFCFRELSKWIYKNIANWWEPHAVLVIGSGRLSKSIERVLRRHPEIAVFSRTARDSGELRRLLADMPVREVYVGEPDLSHETLIKMSEACDGLNVPFKIVPDVLELRMGEVVFDDSLGLPTFQIKPVALHELTFAYKRCFDVAVSTLLISLTFFPLLIISVLIWLDSRGPVFLRQSRLGHRRRPFPFIKFRTMIPNADDFLEDLKKKSERSGPVFKMKDDPRVTRVGKWLRRYSMDEIPQLINVLRGEMSLVGPRPQVLWETEAYDDWAKKRLNVLPGITGLWQVSGRAQLSYEEMIDLDIFYIEHWSPGLDLMILFKTIPTILLGQGAY